MPVRQPHGGQCCGIKHYRSFYESIETLLPMLAEEVRISHNARTCLEVVLTSDQVAMYGRHLEGHGFKPVFKFQNGNSLNSCTVYYYHPAPIPVSPCSDPILPVAPVAPTPTQRNVVSLVGRRVRIVETRCHNYYHIATIVSVRFDRFKLSTGQVLRRSSFQLLP